MDLENFGINYMNYLMKKFLCKFCKTKETGRTLDGKSDYIKHNVGCQVLINSTDTGR
jgi:hypothetical protein